MEHNGIRELLLQLEDCARSFCRETDGINTETVSEFKGRGDETDLRDLIFRYERICYNSFVCEFRYTAHSFMSVTNSILECYVYTGKTEYDVAIPLQFWIDYLDVDEATPLSIPCISNADGMREAFELLSGTLRTILGRIGEILSDQEKKSKLHFDFDAEYRYICDVKTEKSEEYIIPYIEYDYYYKYLTLRYTSSAYLQYINGNVPRALKELKKQKKLLGYEVRMLRLWEEEPSSVSSVMPSVVKNTASYKDVCVPKNEFKEFFAMFLSWLVLSVVISPLCLALFYTVVSLERRGTLYLMGPEYNFPYCIMVGFFIAIAVSYFTRFWFYKLLFKKDYDRYRELDGLQNGKGTDKFMHGFLAVVIGVGCVACVLFGKWNISFGEQGFTDNGRFFSVQGEYHSYSEIERVYYRPGRVNDFGDELDLPSYVIAFFDGSELDLYEYGDTADYECELLPILEQKGVNICREPNG